MVAPTTVVAGFLSYRLRFAGDHRFVDVARPALDRAVDGDLLAGADAAGDRRQSSRSTDTLRSPPSSEINVGGLGGESEQGLDRLAGPAAGLGFQKLPHQDERGDDRGSFEIQVHLAVVAEGSGKHGGK